MCALHLATSWAGVEILHVPQSLACHLPMASLHVGGLLLGHGTKDRSPDVRKQTRNRQRYRSWSQEGLGQDGGGLEEPGPPTGRRRREGERGHDRGER